MNLSMKDQFSKAIYDLLAKGGFTLERLPSTKLEWLSLLSIIDSAMTDYEGMLMVLEANIQNTITQAEAQKEKVQTESIDLLRQAVEAIDSGLVLYNENEELVFCNEKYRQIYPELSPHMSDGFKYENIVRSYYRSQPRIQDSMNEQDYIMLRKQKFRNQIGRYESSHKNKTLVVSTAKIKNGSIVSLSTDITEQKLREQQIKALLDAMPGHVSWVDKDLNYLGVNGSLASSMGKKPEEFIGNKLGFMGVVSEPNISDKMTIFFKSTDRQLQFETIMQTNSGPLHLLVCSQKYSDLTKAVVISIDLTHQKQLEKDLEDEKQRFIINSRLTAMGEMAAGLAHEINNPVAIINGKANSLKRLALNGKLTNEKILEETEKIISTTNRISKIVNGLRNISRDGGQDQIVDVSFQIILDDTMEFANQRMQSHGIQLFFPDNLKDLVIPCRQVQLSQVILNLLNNAHDAIFENTEKWIKIEAYEKNDFFEIRIMDSGHGIPLDVQQKLFQPFFTTKEVGKGTGLGLSISLGIIKSHNGRMYIDNNCKNTCFIIELPKKSPTAKAA